MPVAMTDQPESPAGKALSTSYTECRTRPPSVSRLGTGPEVDVPVVDEVIDDDEQRPPGVDGREPAVARRPEQLQAALRVDRAHELGKVVVHVARRLTRHAPMLASAAGAR